MHSIRRRIGAPVTYDAQTAPLPSRAGSLPQGNAFQGGSEPAREWHHLGYRRTEVVYQLRL
ncbi:hypothetical protein DMX03_04285 [Pseudomonas koreensis]|nr:hypothetical protein DMX03_04285 [Pseudomonas koreensis]